MLKIAREKIEQTSKRASTQPAPALQNPTPFLHDPNPSDEELFTDENFEWISDLSTLPTDGLLDLSSIPLNSNDSINIFFGNEVIENLSLETFEDPH